MADAAVVACRCLRSPCWCAEPRNCLPAPRSVPSMSPQEGIQRREVGLANAAGMALLGGLCLYRGCQDADSI